MKLLFLTHKFYPNIGGTEANSEFLAGAFSRLGAEVHLLTWTTEIGEKNFPYTVIRNPNTKTLLREHKWADIVFENSPCLRLSWPGWFIKNPFVIALNTWLNNGWQAKIKYEWLKRASAVIAVSDAIRKGCWPKALVIENTYDANLFTKDPTISRNKSFVFLGRLVSDKGAYLAIEALGQLKQQEKEIQNLSAALTLTVVGEGPEMPFLRKKAAELDVEDRIDFKGTLRGKELVACLNQHKYLLVPSVWEEPFGIVALEGIACGCIPIVSDGGGLPDAIGNSGITFKRGDSGALTASIKNLLQDTELEKKLWEAAPAHLKAHEPDIIANKYWEVITSLL
jgi:glycosyltransferase involved in cell wall biosynthesis